MSDELKAKYPDVNPFLLKKWEQVFNKFFDANVNSTIERADFFVINRHCRDIYGADSDQAHYAKKALMALWAGLEKMADENKDHKVQLDEWIKCLKGTKAESAPKWFEEYLVFMFKLFDVSADSLLDLAEYTDGMAAYGVDGHMADRCFKKFAVDKKGKPISALTLDQFKETWNEFFYSTDEGAKGNVLFGEIL